MYAHLREVAFLPRERERERERARNLVSYSWYFWGCTTLSIPCTIRVIDDNVRLPVRVSTTWAVGAVLTSRNAGTYRLAFATRYSTNKERHLTEGILSLSNGFGTFSVSVVEWLDELNDAASSYRSVEVLVRDVAAPYS
jgi:hypothetical protein